MGGEGGGPAGCRGETNISSSRPLSVTWEGARWSSATGSNGRQLASEALSLTLSLSQSSASTVPAVALTPRETRGRHCQGARLVVLQSPPATGSAKSPRGLNGKRPFDQVHRHFYMTVVHKY